MKYWIYKSIFNVLNFELLTSESKKPITKLKIEEEKDSGNVVT